MHAASVIMVGLVISGLAFGFQDTPAEEGPQQNLVVPPRDVKQHILEDVKLLGMAEYHCHWTRFHADVMTKFTDISIELAGTAESFRSTIPDDDTSQLLREFTDAKWEKLGAEIGNLTLANGIDDSMNWLLFARSAGAQVVQRILAGDNNWPQMGTVIADQAVALARIGQDRIWIRFGERVGNAVERGTPEQWSQWGLQIGLQARSRTRDLQVDWEAFAADVAAQAKWFESTLEPRNPKKD